MTGLAGDTQRKQFGNQSEGLLEISADVVRHLDWPRVGYCKEASHGTERRETFSCTLAEGACLCGQDSAETNAADTYCVSTENFGH